MFTGIIETTGIVKKIFPEYQNIHFVISSSITSELKVDQSIAHNGVCLTVTEISGNEYSVTAIKETLEKTNLGSLKEGSVVNLERSLVFNGRVDGHLVQGHVDMKGICVEKRDANGSWVFSFKYDPSKEKEGYLTVEKGSVAVNGVSLTVVNSKSGEFSVAVIPYTFEHTSFRDMHIGDAVNLEFDIIGKYLAKFLRKA